MVHAIDTIVKWEPMRAARVQSTRSIDKLLEQGIDGGAEDRRRAGEASGTSKPIPALELSRWPL